MTTRALSHALDPTSIAIIGASENPDKVGGRPLMYLSRFGYRGRVYPVNARRSRVQGHDAYPTVADVPEPPDLAVIAVPGDAAIEAVEQCAARGARVAMVLTSGFAETGAHGERQQARLVAAARAGDMRLVGPNCQGLVNFGNRMVATFSTVFLEVPPEDGPVAVISQSGIMSVVPYALLRKRGVGVRHAHATGNGADVSVADMALAVLDDPVVRLLLLYLESVPDPAALARVAARAREREVPIVAVKSGRTPAGQAAARSHTAALANEDRVVDAFLRHLGIWRATDVHDLVNATELYLSGATPGGRRLAVVANSGGVGVMAVDATDEMGLPLATLGSDTSRALAARLPPFTQPTNPVDVTGALLTDSTLIGDALSIVARDPAVDLLFLGIPVAGRQGYDLTRFASDAARVMRESGKPLAAATVIDSVADSFRQQGVPTFDRDRSALSALAQIVAHARLRSRERLPWLRSPSVTLLSGHERFLSEAQSLALLDSRAIPVVPWALCQSSEAVRLAFRALGPSVVVKGCAADLPHKTEHALVALGLQSEAAALEAFEHHMETMRRLRVAADGVILASMVSGRHELAIGARVDPQFGPIALIGAGGTAIETLGDVRVLIPPFDVEEALEAIARLRVSVLLSGGRGRPSSDVEAVAAMAVAVAQLLADSEGQIASIDLNPVMVGPAGQGALAADAVVERLIADRSSPIAV